MVIAHQFVMVLVVGPISRPGKIDATDFINKTRQEDDHPRIIQI